MRKHSPLPALLLAATLLAACDGGKGTTGVADSQLSQADAAALNRALFASSASFASGTVPVGARGTRTLDASGSSTFTFSLNTVQPCAPQGSVAISGMLTGNSDAVARTGRLQANLAVRHHDCAVRLDNGRTLKLNGDPGIELTLDASANDTGLSALHLTESGAFTWQLDDGSSGRCAVDVVAELDAGGSSVHLTGSFCGWPVDTVVDR